MNKRELRKCYNNFIENIEKSLIELKKIANINEFNFSLEEMMYIRSFFEYSSCKALITFNEEWVYEREFEDIYSKESKMFIAYFGSVILEKYGGDWTFSDDKRLRSYGCPTIRNYRRKKRRHIAEFNPYSWLSNLKNKGEFDIDLVFGNNDNQF